MNTEVSGQGNGCGGWSGSFLVITAIALGIVWHRKRH